MKQVTGRESTVEIRACLDENLEHASLIAGGSVRHAVDSLFRRFAVEMLVVGLRIAAGMVDDSRG